MNTTESDNIFQFRQALHAAGLDYAGEIIADGTLHRVKVNGDRNPNGWYVIFPDHPAAGEYGCWKRGIKETWKADGPEFSAEQRAEQQRRIEAARQARQETECRRNATAAEQGRAILDAGRDAGDDHPYLERKAVKAHSGVRVGDWPKPKEQRVIPNALLIPLRQSDGALASVQAIFPQVDPAMGRDKDLLAGGKKRGAYFVIGDLQSSTVVLIAEGYATAATLHEATGHAAVMAVDAGNLKPVALTLQSLCVGKILIVCADNDRQTEGNPGLTKAAAAAKASRARLAAPTFADGDPGSDFNDLAALHGLDALRVCIDGALAASPAEPQSPPANPDRAAEIHCAAGTLPEMTDAAEVALCKHGANLYQRGGQLVRWSVSRAETVRGITRPSGTVVILPLDADYLVDQMNRLIRWTRWNERAGEMALCNAPRQVASALLSRRGLWQAQPLVGAINAPTLRPDGSVLDAPGYDAATGLLFVSTGPAFPAIPAQPTRTQAETALAFLFDEVLSGFPFAKPHDQSAALSAILTACVRHALKAAPMHVFTAPVMASGKSLLGDSVSLIAGGNPATVMSYTSDGDEMRKRVLSVLMQGDQTINIDNIEEPLASQTLCSVLTQETFTDRLLGANKTATAPTSCTWLATGNNLVVAGDLTTRVVLCNLDPRVERPEEREFDRNLYEWIPQHRPQLVVAALTILRAYIVVGRPRQPIKNFARFEEWSALVRSALVWLGEADPLEGRDKIEDGDPVRAKLRALLIGWHSAFRTAPATSKEAVTRANATHLDDKGNEVPIYPALREVLGEFFADKLGRPNSRCLGEFLKKYAGRIDQGARFEAAGVTHQAVKWQVGILDAARFAKFSKAGEKDSHDSHDSPPPPPPSGESGEPGEPGESTTPGPANFAVESTRPEPPARPAPDPVDQSPLARRILERLVRAPGGVADDELKREVGNGKGASPSMIDVLLGRLAKEGAVSRVNGRWVKSGGVEAEMHS